MEVREDREFAGNEADGWFSEVPVTPPACLNCHSVRETPPNFSDPKILASWATPEGKAPACTAQPQWPQWLSESYPNLQKLPWWVRSNYEAVRQEKLTTDGKTAPPFRIDVGKADVDAVIYPAASSTPTPFLFQSNFRVEPGPSAKATSHLEIRDNNIPLTLKSLMEFQDVGISLGKIFGGELDRASFGNYGELHLIIKPYTLLKGGVDMITPFMAPSMEIGYDWPRDGDYDDPACQGQTPSPTLEVDCLPMVPWVYQDRKDPRRDFILTSRIPKEFLKANGRFPSSYTVEELIDRIQAYQRKHAKPPEPGKKLELEKWLSYLQPGSRLSFSLQELKDFFMPGVIDLGPSSGRVNVAVGPDKTVRLDVPDLHVQIDPMDYPAVPKKERPSVHLEAGQIVPGEIYTNPQGEILEPGIHATLDPATQVMKLTANLDLNLELTLPTLGQVQLRGQLLTQTECALTADGIKLLPKTNAIQLKGLEIIRTKDKFNLLSEAEILISDDPAHMKAGEDLLYGKAGAPVAILRVKGRDEKGNSFSLSGHVPIPTTGEGSYDFAKIFRDFPLDMVLEWEPKAGNRLQSNLSFSITPLLDAMGVDTGNKIFNLGFDLNRTTTQSSQPETVVKNGKLFVKRVKQEVGHDQYSVELKADQFQWGNLVLVLAPYFHLKLNQATFSEGITEVRIPTFLISANPQGSPKGLVRGPIRIEQKNAEGEDLILVWRGPDKQAKLTGLDLAFSGQGLTLIPKGLKAFLPRSVASMGIDGHWKGHFTMNFPEDRTKWNGSGDMRLRGDPDGDIYFLDSQGRRVGSPVFRDTRWSWTRVDWINWKRGYALGQFKLDTLINLEALFTNHKKGQPNPLSVLVPPAYGIHGQKLGPYEFEAMMPYDNQPIFPHQYRNRIVDYIVSICSQDPRCRAETAKKEVKP